MQLKGLVVVLLVVTLVRCAPQVIDEEQILEDQQDHSALLNLTHAVRRFNKLLFEKVSNSELGNFVYSPYSLHTALSLLALGAPRESKTFAELASLLDYDKDTFTEMVGEYLKIFEAHGGLGGTEGIEILLANKLFVDESLEVKESFLRDTEKYFNSTTGTVQFGNSVEATNIINQFVSTQTKGLIPEIFEQGSLEPLTRLVLINAVYFKGDWFNPFNVSETAPMKFHIDEGREIEYEHGMNTMAKVRFASINELDADILELPYTNEDGKSLVMIIVLPKPGLDIEHLQALMGRFDTDIFQKRLTDQSFFADVKIQMPRFECSFEMEGLPDFLTQLGVSDVFSPEKSNLTKISDEPLYASKIAHKSVIKVNEEGSEAASVTGISIEIRVSMPREIRTFVVDRPFLFYIYDEILNLPLFVGRIIDPSGNHKLTSAEIKPRLDSPDDCIVAAGSEALGLPCKGRDVQHVEMNQEANMEIEKNRFHDKFE